VFWGGRKSHRILGFFQAFLWNWQVPIQFSCSPPSRRGVQKFFRNQMHILIVRMLWTEPNKSPILATSQTLILLFSRTYSSLNPHFHLFFPDRHHGHSVSSTQITLFLKLENQSQNICSCAVCILKATFEIPKVYIAFFPSLKQNLVYSHSSCKPAIFQVHQNSKWNNIHVLNTLLLSNHTCYGLIPCRKWLSRLCLHLVVEGHTSSSTAISWSEKVKVKFLTMPWSHIGEAEV
jgi:hypothetical protein